MGIYISHTVFMVLTSNHFNQSECLPIAKIQNHGFGAKRGVRSVGHRESRKIALLLVVLMDAVVTSLPPKNVKRRQKDGRESKNARITKLSKKIAEEPVQINQAILVESSGNTNKHLQQILKLQDDMKLNTKNNYLLSNLERQIHK